MKIINQGKWQESWNLDVVCKNSNCGATLLVEEEDVQPTFNQIGKFYVKCMVCDTILDLDTKLIHPRIIREVEKKRKFNSFGDKD